MPATYDIPGTDPPITLRIYHTAQQTGVPPTFFTAALLDGYIYFLHAVMAAGHDRPIPREGVTFTVGATSIQVLSAIDVPSEGGVLDYYTLGSVFRAIWWLLTTHGHYTYIFQVVLGARRDFVAGTVHITYETSNAVDSQ